MKRYLFLVLWLIAAPAAAQNPVTIAGPDPLPVEITVPPSTWPLPTGAATEATLAAINGKLPALVSGRVPVDGSGVTQPVSGTVTVTATNLDIHDLAFATDKVDVSGSTGVGVTGTFFQATQPISAAALPLPSGASTSANQATEIASLASIDAKLTNPLPISGTVTANAGTNLNTSALALSATQTDGTQQTQLTDGVTVAAVKAASTAAADADPALVVGLNPLSSGVTPPYDTASGNLTALNSAVTLTGHSPSFALGSGNVGLYITAAPMTATYVAEVSFNSGVTWDATKFFDPEFHTFSSTLAKAGAGALTSVIVSYSGVTDVRVRVSAYTVGSAGGFLQSLPDNQNPLVVVQGASLIGSLASAVKPWQVSIGGPVAGDSFATVRGASSSAVAADPALVIRTVQLPTALAAGGGIKVEGVAGGVAVPVSSTTLSTLAEQQTQTTALQLIDNAVSGAGFNVTQLGGVNVSMNTGVRDTGTQRVTIATDDVVPISGTVTANQTASNIASIAFSESVAAPTAATWYVRKQWALPASAVAIPSRAFAAVTTAAGSRTLIAVINSLGTLNTGTNAFAAVNSVASPFFYGRLFGCVTTVLSATLDTITVTYTDELGVSSTSGAVAFAASSPVGNCFEFPLGAGSPTSALDSGVRAITNITDTAATTGVVTVYGVTTLLESLGTTTLDSTLLDTGRLNANEQIAILEIQTLTTAQQRTAGVTISIR